MVWRLEAEKSLSRQTAKKMFTNFQHPNDSAKKGKSQKTAKTAKRASMMQ